MLVHSTTLVLLMPDPDKTLACRMPEGTADSTRARTLGWTRVQTLAWMQASTPASTPAWMRGAAVTVP
jgi:hypothetical protein